MGASEHPTIIRTYAVGDRSDVLARIRELQDHERRVEADRLPGDAIAEAHLDYLLAECANRDGVLFVAVQQGHVVGFTCVWSQEEFGEHYAVPATAGYVSDLVVEPSRARHGIGRALQSAAEDFVRARGHRILVVDSLARNTEARQFYSSAGYREYEVRYVKAL